MADESYTKEQRERLKSASGSDVLDIQGSPSVTSMRGGVAANGGLISNVRCPSEPPNMARKNSAVHRIPKYIGEETDTQVYKCCICVCAKGNTTEKKKENVYRCKYKG